MVVAVEVELRAGTGVAATAGAGGATMSPDSSAVTILSRVPLACVFEICVAALNSPSFASPETEKTDSMTTIVASVIFHQFKSVIVSSRYRVSHRACAAARARLALSARSFRLVK